MFCKINIYCWIKYIASIPYQNPSIYFSIDLVYEDDSFSASPFLPTIGIDFRTKIVSVDERMVKLQVW